MKAAPAPRAEGWFRRGWRPFLAWTMGMAAVGLILAVALAPTFGWRAPDIEGMFAALAAAVTFYLSRAGEKIAAALGLRDATPSPQPPVNTPVTPSPSVPNPDVAPVPPLPQDSPPAAGGEPVPKPEIVTQAPPPEPAPIERAGWELSPASRRRLEGVHPDLVRVLERAARDGAPPFVVIEGVRARQRQVELVAAGASRTMNSRHLHGLAADVAPTVAGRVSWDWPLYYPLAAAIKAAAQAEGVPVEWGGDWRSFPDGPHWQLPRAVYPDPAGVPTRA